MLLTRERGQDNPVDLNLTEDRVHDLTEDMILTPVTMEQIVNWLDMTTKQSPNRDSANVVFVVPTDSVVTSSA